MTSFPRPFCSVAAGFGLFYVVGSSVVPNATSVCTDSAGNLRRAFGASLLQRTSIAHQQAFVNMSDTERAWCKSAEGKFGGYCRTNVFNTSEECFSASVPLGTAAIQFRESRIPVEDDKGPCIFCIERSLLRRRRTRRRRTFEVAGECDIYYLSGATPKNCPTWYAAGAGTSTTGYWAKPTHHNVFCKILVGLKDAPLSDLQWPCPNATGQIPDEAVDSFEASCETHLDQLKSNADYQKDLKNDPDFAPRTARMCTAGTPEYKACFGRLLQYSRECDVAQDQIEALKFSLEGMCGVARSIAQSFAGSSVPGKDGSSFRIHLPEATAVDLEG